MLPKIRENKWINIMHLQAEANNGQHRFIDDYNQMVAEIQNATDGPPLLPLEEAIQLSKQADEEAAK